jgi:Flp pilus assembly protein TadD
LAAGQAAEALRLTDTVLSKTPAELPERFTTQVLRSQCLDETGDVAGAVQILEKLLEARPGNVTTMNNLAFLLADRAGRPQEALPYAESACEQDSQNPSYLDTLGWVYFKNGKYVEAEVVLKQAVTLSPEFLPALYHLGLLHADRGRSADAKALLRRAQPFATAQKNAEYEKKIAEALDRLP